MRSRFRNAAIAMFAATLWLASPAHSAFNPTFGQSWDGPSQNLQNILDGLYGAGAINVQTDYIGAQPGDIDPWFWVDNTFTTYLIREIAGNANRNTLGWYHEPGLTPPVIDGIDDGIVFDGPAGPGAQAVVAFADPYTRFGFYLDPNGPLDAPFAPQPERFYTNRRFNDRGPSGGGGIHSPYDGDVQALVFDISGVIGVPNTWLVCFEDIDSGPNPSPCCNTTDNDYNDFIFEVHAFGATPVKPVSFGQVKMLYR